MNMQEEGSENRMYNEIERINWHILLLRTSECNLAFLITTILGWKFGGLSPQAPDTRRLCAPVNSRFR